MNEKELGICTGGYLFIYDCPLSEIKETYEDVEEGRNLCSLKAHHLYADAAGGLHVFYPEKPKESRFPWFTVITGSENQPKYEFNPNRYRDMESIFQESELGDISVMNAIDNIPDKPIKYNEAVEKSMTRAGAIYRPVVKKNDDFLKKLTKCHIILSGVDVKTEFKSKMKTQYQLSNSIQSLDGTSKQNPLAFAEWADWNGLDFEIKMMDSKTVEKTSKLNGELIYRSADNSIVLRKEDGTEYECIRFDSTIGSIMEETPDEMEDEYDDSVGDDGGEFAFE